MLEEEITPKEKLLLCNFENDIDVSEASAHINNLYTGNWECLLKDGIFEKILTNYENVNTIKDIFSNIDENKQEEVLNIGIASLFCFIQNNFTGPEISKSLSEYLTKCVIKNVNQYLTIDGEEIYTSVKNPELLLITKTIFENCHLNNSKIILWWKLRYVIIHQHLLEEYSQTLFSQINETIDDLKQWNLNPRLKAKLHLEIAHFYLLFGQINEAESHCVLAKELLKLKFELSGELGKRTKFQQTDIAQIVLNVSLNEEINNDFHVERNTVIPEVIKLDDDVRLDKIQLNHNQNKINLPVQEQATILTAVQIMQRSKPKDEFLLEESDAFLSVLLQQQTSWTVRFNVLILRCFLESRHKRTIERSLSQCESLLMDLNKEVPNVIERLGIFWCVGMQPKWKSEMLMANLMLNLGLIKAALDLFLRLQMWEEVIVCYTIMQLRHKAAEIIKTQLNQNPTVKLWCLLGDATDDEFCYEKAWELSQHKSGRAQRHWGQYLFGRKEYNECIPHLQKSLEINSLQNMVWLRLGFAALEVEDWKLAANAYRRYTYLEPGGFEAWNNMAKAYIKLGEKTRAHYALQEALKYSFDNWKIWDNFMMVSAATKHFSDVVRAYHQILNHKNKHLDLEVLYLLTKHLLTETVNDESLMNKSRELFGRVTSLYPNESKLWELYSDLSPSAELKAQRLYRAYRGLVQDDWAKNADKCGRVLDICRRLAEATIEANVVGTTSSTRLTLRSVITAAKKQAWEQHETVLQSVEDLLQKILLLNTK